MIKVAILGAGAIADSHLEAYLHFPDRCQVVAVADLELEKAAVKARRHALVVPVFNGLEPLLDSVQFDLASVCLPPFAHATAAVNLLRAGKHVLVEKPMATSLEECDAMIAAAAAAQVRLSVVAQNRFKTPMMRLKRILELGLIGRVLHTQVNSFWWRGSCYYDLWWRGTWEKEGGGCTLNHAVHYIDLLRWFVGMPAALSAVMLNLAHDNSEVEDFAAAVLWFAGGSVGQITTSLIHHGEEQQLIVQGERAQVALPWRVQAAQARANGFPEDNAELAAHIQTVYDQLPALPCEGHAGQIANLLEAIEGRAPLLVDGREGRGTLELITAIYQSSHLGRPVSLPLGPDDLFYTRKGILQHAPRFHQKTRSVPGFATNDITLGRFA